MSVNIGVFRAAEVLLDDLLQDCAVGDKLNCVLTVTEIRRTSVDVTSYLKTPAVIEVEPEFTLHLTEARRNG